MQDKAVRCASLWNSSSPEGDCFDLRYLSEEACKRKLHSAIFFWYRMDTPDSLKIDKTAFTVASLFDQSDDKAYWLAKTPYERLEAVEIMRQIIYGYSPSTARLQRVLAVAQRSSG